jgi:hypothetical protein
MGRRVGRDEFFFSELKLKSLQCYVGGSLHFSTLKMQLSKFDKSPKSEQIMVSYCHIFLPARFFSQRKCFVANY